MITKKLLEKKKLKWKIILTPLFPFIWFWFWLKNILRNPILRPGIHAITGDTGSGKTLLASIVSRKLKSEGKRIYSNSEFNSIVNYFKLTDIFDKLELQSDRLIRKEKEPTKVVIFDEIQRDFNKRMNQRRDYNEVFIPLIEWLSTHRHNGITHVYFITQAWNRLDIQIQDYIQKVHMVSSKKYPSYKAWLRDKKMRPLIRPWKIKYYTRKKKDLEMDDIQRYVNRKKDIKYKKVKPFKMPVSLHELADFNTYAFKTANIMKKDEKKN